MASAIGLIGISGKTKWFWNWSGKCRTSGRLEDEGEEKATAWGDSHPDFVQYGTNLLAKFIDMKIIVLDRKICLGSEGGNWKLLERC